MALYLLGVELTHNANSYMNNLRLWAQDLHHSTALFEAAKSLVPLPQCKRIWQIIIPETLAKVYGAWCIPHTHNDLAKCKVSTHCEWSIVPLQWI